MPMGFATRVGELLVFRQFFHSVTHCYRQANVPADRLSKIGTELGSNIVYDSFSQCQGWSAGTSNWIN